MSDPHGVPPQPDGDETIELRNKDPAGVRIVGRVLRGIVRAGSRAFGWLRIFVLDVFDDEGEHVAIYVKANKHAKGNTWPLVLEVRDTCGLGGVFGPEIDMMMRERDPNVTRKGCFIVVGQALPPEVGHLDRGYTIVPFRRMVDGRIVADNVRLPVAYDCEVACEVFAAAPSGSWITLDDDRNIGIVFDRGTGFALYGRKDVIGTPPDWRKASLAIQCDNGWIASKGRTVIGPA